MSGLKLEIISPEGVVFAGDCHMAVVPSVAGEMGVMRGHESVVAALHEGKITIYDDKQEIIKQIAVSGGFAEVLASAARAQAVG